MTDTQKSNEALNGELEEIKANPAAEEVSVATDENLTQEVNEVTENQEEAVVASELPVSQETKEVETAPVQDYSKLTKAQIIAQLEKLTDQPIESVRKDVDLLKQAFYKQQKAEYDKLKKEFVDAGGVEEEFVMEPDSLENMLKNLLAGFREKRAALVAEQEKQKEEVQGKRASIIDKLKGLTENSDDINKQYTEFRKLQQEWNELKQSTQVITNEQWKSYQHYVEKFYDFLKINNEFREYDFKKNLEIKNALCETVEKLAAEEDVVSAFHQLQKFHQNWRDTGPVAKEQREELWQRFKTASSVINKRHQQYFESLRSSETANLEEKQAICKEVESIDFEKLKFIKDWEEKTKEVIALQEKWKAIGFAPKKSNVKVFEHFRALCDEFFKKKSDFYKSIKEDMSRNLELKLALCEKAEALKDSTEWRETTDVFVKLQKEWKTIGSVPKKHSDAVWKRFSSACDHFFETKNASTANVRSTEHANLERKKEIIEEIKAIDPALAPKEAVVLLRQLISKWNSVGFVPFKDKDKIHKELNAAVDEQYARLNVSDSNRKFYSYKNDNAEASGKGGGHKVYRERDKLMHQYEMMKSDLQTAENNIGFFTGKNKSGNSLIKELENKIVKLKADIEEIVKKIEAIDNTMDEAEA
ncbi:MAG: DUF349 domain-containing protein [Bacteroidales bacterium]|nr:DUF349 domain-containing protein [Bacteroidales bacterium]MDD4823456.1 DUF349 domain-containing protein [Bacteroidales bacterium]